MKIEIQIDADCKEPKVVVMTDRMTDETKSIISKLSNEHSLMIAGFRDDMVEVLDQASIDRVFASGGKVLAETSNGEYVIRMRLYEMEQRLDNHNFVRISNSEIINLRKVKGFDLSLAGTICVKLISGTVTYVSRRYVARIRQVLGI